MKIRTFMSINNHTPHVLLSRALFLEAQALGLPSAIQERFGRQRIMAPLLGFYSTADIPLWRVGTLTGEEYVDEDVLNAMLEMDYLWLCSQNSGVPGQLLLPTSFYNAASVLYTQSPRMYFANLCDVRERLAGLELGGFGFVVCRDSHYTGYNYNKTAQLRHYDSLGGAPIPGIEEIINWVLDGLTLPRITSVESDIGPLQSNDSGSCGLAVESFLAAGAGIPRKRWSQGQSGMRRGEWIHRFVEYHMHCFSKGVSLPFVFVALCCSTYHVIRLANPTDGLLWTHDVLYYSTTWWWMKKLGMVSSTTITTCTTSM